MYCACRYKIRVRVVTANNTYCILSFVWGRCACTGLSLFLLVCIFVGDADVVVG